MKLCCIKICIDTNIKKKKSLYIGYFILASKWLEKKENFALGQCCIKICLIRLYRKRKVYSKDIACLLNSER